MSTLMSARFFPTSNIRYTIILKNACTSIQATLLEGEGISTHELTGDQVHNRTIDFPDVDNPSARTVVVVRDPYKRFVSAFLDRVVIADFPATGSRVVRAAVLPLVRPDLAASAELSAESLSYDEQKKEILAELSLSDLARIVALTPDDFVENHFKSQGWFMGDRDHDDVISMESPTWKDDLAKIFGRPLREMRPHSTDNHQGSRGEVPNAAQLSVREIRARFQRDGTLPSREDLLTEEIRGLIRSRYKGDFLLRAKPLAPQV